MLIIVMSGMTLLTSMICCCGSDSENRNETEPQSTVIYGTQPLKPTLISNDEMPTSYPTSYPSLSPEIISEWEGVYIGMPADDVLRIHPNDDSLSPPEILGTDENGLIVQWSYPGANLILAIRRGTCPKGVDLDSCSCYRVIEIRAR
jgi:hypothetical protein